VASIGQLEFQSGPRPAIDRDHDLRRVVCWSLDTSTSSGNVLSLPKDALRQHSARRCGVLQRLLVLTGGDAPPPAVMSCGLEIERDAVYFRKLRPQTG